MTVSATMQWGHLPLAGDAAMRWGHAPSPLRGWGYPHPLVGESDTHE